MHWVEKPGTSLDAMTRLTVQASRDLRKVEGVRNFGSHIGRAEVADEVVGPNFTELWISVDPKKNFGQTMGRIQAVIDGYPGLVQKDVLTYLKERIKEVLTGAGATVVVRTFGPNMDVLRAKAAEIAAAVKTVPGVTDLKVESQVLVPQLDVRLRPEAAARLGLTAGRRPPRGDDAGQGVEGRRGVPRPEGLRRLRLGRRQGPQRRLALDTLPIETPLGTHVPLGDVADVSVVAAPEPDHARGGLAAARRDLQRRRAATSAASPARSRPRSRRSTSPASTTPSSSASTPPARSPAAA